MSVEIPTGMSGKTLLPAGEVTESGVPVSKAAGLRFVRTEKGRAVFEAVSGKYEFQVRRRQAGGTGTQSERTIVSAGTLSGLAQSGDADERLW